MSLTTVDDHKADLIEIHDPATGERVGAVAMAGREEIDAALALAHREQRGWARTAAAARGRRSGNGYGPELLDEMTQTKVVHLALAGTA